MKQNISRPALWNNAGAAGLVLGTVSAAYLFINQFLSGQGQGTAIWAIAVNFILWAVKFIGCIFLMKFFMKKFAEKYNITENAATFRFGMATSFCSALLYSAVTLANVLLISPDLIHTQMETAMQVYGPMLDSNSMSMLDSLEAMMPQIMFFSNLIYCFLYGILLSAVLSRNIPSKDPFANYNDPDKTEE